MVSKGLSQTSHSGGAGPLARIASRRWIPTDRDCSNGRYQPFFEEVNKGNDRPMSYGPISKSKGLAVDAYILALRKEYLKGDATEHTHRHALKALLESHGPGVQATNEPKSQERRNRPDYIVRSGAAIIGFVEAKDLDVDLNGLIKSPQIERYLDALPNLLLTNYLDFVWFVSGREQMRVTLGALSGKSITQAFDCEGQWNKISQSFFNQVSPTIGTSTQLSTTLAGQTRLLRDLVKELIEAEDPELLAQEGSFKALLVPDLSREEFADMYAQTAAYGLFTARIFEHATLLGGSPEALPHSMKSDSFNLEKAAYLIPKANPFLRQFFLHVASPALNSQLRWLIEQIADALRFVDVDKVLYRQGKKPGFEDPVFHFYETFLSEYDSELRHKRGVYYTPEPVVHFIVHAVDSLLKDRLGRDAGLADKSTFILDPATGTATFLRKIIDVIHARIAGGASAGTWPQYVHERLLPRIFGFEWMMAPYTVAHLKLELQLQEQGYSFAPGERLHVYLTNTLDQLHQKTHALIGQWIAQENEGAEKVKLHDPVEIVLGNPPYYGESRNKSPWIMGLLQTYKTEPEGGPLKERNSKWLNNDYVKFIRFAQDRIARTGHGVVAFITSSSWLEGPIFRGMRSQLMQEFDEIYLLDLHGNSNKGERTPAHLADLGEDKNVFDIQEGVSISLFVKKKASKGEDFALAPSGPSAVKKAGKQSPTKLAGGMVEHRAQVHYAELWGSRATKYETLESRSFKDIPWEQLTPRLPLLLFVPRDDTDIDEYEAGWKVTDIFPFSGTGIITKSDQLNIHFSQDECLALMKWFVTASPASARKRLRLPKATVRDWSIENAVEDILSSKLDPTLIKPILYRPLDTRYVYYTGKSKGVIGWPVERLARQFSIIENTGIITSRMTKGESFAHAQVTDKISEVICMSSKTSNNGFVFPLWIVPPHVGSATSPKAQSSPNLSPPFLAALAGALGRPQVAPFGMPEDVLPEDVQAYVYGVLHAPSYRTRYVQYLKSDFPRIPLGVTAHSGVAVTFSTIWNDLVPLGRELMALHLIRAVPSDLRAHFPESGSGIVDFVKFEIQSGAASGRVRINATQYFDGIEPETWKFKVGGYQVCDKWLKYRRGRHLSLDDIERYQDIIAILTRTRAIMSEVDEIVNGRLWPSP